MNARLAFGVLLLLGIADLGLINFKLAPALAEEQAKQAQLAAGTQGGKPGETTSAKPSEPKATAGPSVAVVSHPDRKSVV